MNSKLKKIILAVSALLVAQSSLAGVMEDITFIPSIAYQHKHYEFDQKFSGANSNEAKFDLNIPTINISLTTAYKKFYVALKYEESLADASTGTTETTRDTLANPGEANWLAVGGSEINVTREDMNITFGWNVWKSMNVFVGYMEGETEITPDPFCANPFGGAAPKFPCSETNRAFLGHFLKQASYRQVYKEDGFYIGAGYAWRIADTGTLSASVAYADLDAELKDNAQPSALLGFFPFKYEGDATGVSLGLTWTAPLGDNSSYIIDLRQQKYSMEGKESLGNFPGTEVETDETMLGLSAGLMFFF